MLKRLSLLFCGLSLIALASGCGTTQQVKTSAQDGVIARAQLSEYAAIPMKDYEPVQIVIYKSQITTSAKSNAFSNSTADIKGSGIVYSHLMEEAQKVNAHAIINVRIERERICDATVAGIHGIQISSKECLVEITGTALAIRYTNLITPINIVPTSDDTAVDQPAVKVESPSLLQRMFN